VTGSERQKLINRRPTEFGKGHLLNSSQPR